MGMGRPVLWLAVLAAGVAASRPHAPLQEAGVYEEGGRLVVRPGRPAAGAVAWGSFEDGLNSTGWGTLDVRVSAVRSDTEQHMAAGVLEGYLTARHIHTTYLNALAYTFHGSVSEAAVAFLEGQMAWAHAQALAHPDDNFWQLTDAVLAQFDGLTIITR